jgi:hypothetical protein
MYRVYGLKLASEMPFPHLLRVERPDDHAPDLVFRIQPRSPIPEDFEQTGSLMWENREANRVSVSVYGVPDGFVFHYPKRVRFAISGDLATVTCVARAGLDDELIRYLFLSLVASFILHRIGKPVLHAGAVRFGNVAAGFLAPAQGGKSSLTAYCVRAGHALVSEDLLPLEIRDAGVFALPGPPQLRLWPDSAAALWADPATLTRHALNTDKRQIWLPLTQRFYSDQPIRLRALYFLSRSDRIGIELTDLSRREALLALVESAFGNFLTTRQYLSRQFDFFAGAVEALTCRRLLVPSGFSALPDIHRAVLGDVTRITHDLAHVAE